MVKVVWQPAYHTTPSPSIFTHQFCKPLGSALPSTNLLSVSNLQSKLSSIAPFKCFSIKNHNTHEASSQSFSALPADTPWDSGSVWSNLAFYMFTLHIPLSFGWLSVVTEILQESVIDPETEAISLLLAQSLELFATLLLLKSTAKPQYEFTNFFKTNELSKERNWLLASSIGFGFLFALVVLTSFLVDRVLEPKTCRL